MSPSGDEGEEGEICKGELEEEFFHWVGAGGMQVIWCWEDRRGNLVFSCWFGVFIGQGVVSGRCQLGEGWTSRR